MTRYPGVSLDLVVDGRLVDIVAEGFDAGSVWRKMSLLIWWLYVLAKMCGFWRWRRRRICEPSILLHEPGRIWPTISAFASVYPAVNASAGSFPPRSKHPAGCARNADAKQLACR